MRSALAATLGVCLVGAPILAACSKSEPPASEADEAPAAEPPAPPAAPASTRFPGSYRFVVEASGYRVEHGLVWDGEELVRLLDGRELGRARCAVERDEVDRVALACDDDYRAFAWRDGAWWDDVSGVRLERTGDAPAREGSGLRAGEGSGLLPGAASSP